MVSGVGLVQWAFDRPVGVQIWEYLYNSDDSKVKNKNIWGYFQNFQQEMHERERIPNSVVEKYQDIICFMVDTDQCLMEAVKPQMIWIMPMGYKVDEQILELHTRRKA